MKNSTTSTSATKFLKNIITMLSSIAKAKSMAIRDKTNGLKDKLVVLSLLRNKKFSLGSIAHKIESILNHKHEDAEVADEEDQSKSIVLYNASVPSSSTETQEKYQEYYYKDYENDDVDKYPDLRHCLFDEEDERDELDLGDPNGSVIDLVRNAKEDGEDFKLEDEIDHVADLFILKFHKRMKLQKLESFKRYQEMLQRGA